MRKKSSVSLPFGALVKLFFLHRCNLQWLVEIEKKLSQRKHIKTESPYISTQQREANNLCLFPVMYWEKAIIVSEWKLICSNDLQNSLNFSSCGNFMRKAITCVCYEICPISQMPDTHTLSIYLFGNFLNFELSSTWTYDRKIA